MISTALELLTRLRRIVPAAVAAAVLIGAAAPISVRVNVHRSSYDLLDALAVTISVDNRTGRPVLARFPTSNLYDIQLLSGKTVVWDYAAANRAVPIAHSQAIAPDLTTLGTFVWDETTGGRSVAPGSYTLRVRLLDARCAPSARIAVRFAPPLPIASLSHFIGKDEVTTAGSLAAGGTSLRDPSGSIALSRRLPAPPPGTPVVVRGYVIRLRNGTLLFDAVRSAPLAPTLRGLVPRNITE